MHPGQEQFLHFILDRVDAENAAEAREILEKNFAKQDAGTFTRGDALTMIPPIIDLVKPDKAAEVRMIMEQYALSMGKM